MLLETVEVDLTSQEENGADDFIAHLVDFENFYWKFLSPHLLSYLANTLVFSLSVELPASLFS
jgi:hypothetical protein